MKSAELRDLLVDQLPAVAGIASAAPWPERPYGLVVTQAATGGCSYWMVTGASGVAPAAADQEQPAPVALPDFPQGKAPVGLVEQALVATVVQAAPGVVRLTRYSTLPAPPAVAFGATVDFSDWRLFLSCAGTSPGTGDRVRPVTVSSEV
jgi:hypothetical protein